MFKVGDIIVGKPESNNRYSCTRQDLDFVGEVIGVNPGHRDDIRVKCISTKDGYYVGLTWWVCSECFELAPISLLIKFLKSLE